MYMFNFWYEYRPGWKCTKGIFDRSKFKVIRDISPTISGWLLVDFEVGFTSHSSRHTITHFADAFSSQSSTEEMSTD